MTIEIDDLSHSTTKKTLSEKEKRDYYMAWECSGMDKSRFCKEHGLSLNAFYYWCKLFKSKKSTKLKQFSPVTIKTAPANQEQDIIQLEIRLPNQAQLFIKLREKQLISFIKDLCNAVTIIR